MSINWEGLHTYEDWANTLKNLLDNTRKALEKNDSAARGAAKRELITFIDESPNWLIRNLDDVAHEAIKDLGKADINEAISGIENRTVELIRLTKSVQSIQKMRKMRQAHCALKKPGASWIPRQMWSMQSKSSGLSSIRQEGTRSWRRLRAQRSRPFKICVRQ